MKNQNQSKNQHGGVRPGAGRPKGSGNLMTKEDKEFLVELAEESKIIAKHKIMSLIDDVEEHIKKPFDSDSTIAQSQVLMEAMENAREASELALRIALETEHPRSIEVAANAAKDAVTVVQNLREWESKDHNIRIKQLKELADSLIKFTNTEAKTQVNLQNNINNTAGMFRVTKDNEE